MVDQEDSSSGRRFVGYVRVSSGNSPSQAQEGIAAQREALERFAEEHGYEIVGWYVDGEPGSEDSDDEDGSFRPALRRLLADARFPDSNFGTVLVWKLSRLSRNQAQFILVRRALQDAGVDVHSVLEGEDASPAVKLIEGVLGTIDAFFKEHCSESARRGGRTRRARANQD